jgi:hypothetical protein
VIIMLDYPDTDAEWITTESHPASGTAYQEIVFDGRVWARITVDGREVVTPSRNPESIYTQYKGRVSRAIDELEDQFVELHPYA